MKESLDPAQQFSNQTAMLADSVVDKRDAVLKPNREYDTQDLVGFLREDLLPQLSREEEVLYDAIDDEAGTALATAALRADHETIEQRVDALASSEPDGASLPIELHELTALLIHHVETEHAELVPALDRLFDEDTMTTLLESTMVESTLE